MGSTQRGQSARVSHVGIPTSGAVSSATFAAISRLNC